MNRARLTLLACICACAFAGRAGAQSLAMSALGDSAITDSTREARTLFPRSSRDAGFSLTSGKRYNRVEGLPVLVGPFYRDSGARVSTHAALLGIVRSADDFHWDSGNRGHFATAGARFGPEQKYSIDASSYDVIAGMQPWQMDQPEAALAAFFLHRDYDDYFSRHGGSLAGAVSIGARSLMQVDLRDERWGSRRERPVFTVFRNGEEWRENPLTDEGRFHLATLAVTVDTRNDSWAPLFGWYLQANYENGRGRLSELGPAQPLARADNSSRVNYGRLFMDLRRYNRISPKEQVNARLVLGGWLHGGELPLERRFSVGGVGTIPGFNFRGRLREKDYAECGEFPVLPGNPAQCERVALLQLEYRGELAEHDIEDVRVFRRNARITLRPTLVAFIDTGRGWLVGPRIREIQYPSSSLPDLATFMTDAGVGFDLGIGSIYVAKAVSVPKEPARVFLRIRRRF